MKFVAEADSLQGALVRRHVFGTPNPGDAVLFEKRIEEILSEQREYGSLGEPGHDKAARLMELADLGVDPERPEVQRAIEAAIRGSDDSPGPWVRDVRALCMIGQGHRPEVKAALQDIIDNQENWNGPHKLCPWGQAFYLRILWAARDVIDTRELTASVLTWIADGVNAAGCLNDKDPWGYVWAAGIIDLPEARRLIELEIPIILRGQQPDGGWGHEPYDAWSRNSLKVFQALVNHDLFDTLRELPPLPPDWRVVREVPAPTGELWTMTWDGARLWAMDRDANEAVALSPDDGAVQQRVPVPVAKPMGIGWWDGGLAVSENGPKRVVKLDPATGEVVREMPADQPDWCEVYDVAQVGDELWVSDGFNGLVRRYTPDGEHRFFGLGGPEPISIAAADDGVWHIDAFAPMIAHTRADGSLADWGEKPFDGECDGLAWDGKRLWALDKKARRICVIEKA
jgi:hypothetical protein